MHPGSDADLQSWLALALTPELSPRTMARLLEAFGSPQAIFAASESELASWKLPPATLKAITGRSSLARAEKELRRAQQLGGCRDGVALGGAGRRCTVELVRPALPAPAAPDVRPSAGALRPRRA